MECGASAGVEQGPRRALAWGRHLWPVGWACLALDVSDSLFQDTLFHDC
jgi:hypothetical protein